MMYRQSSVQLELVTYPVIAAERSRASELIYCLLINCSERVIRVQILSQRDGEQRVNLFDTYSHDQ